MTVTSINTVTRRQAAPAQPDLQTILAAHLDRQADHELHLGRHHQAERLAWQAVELREVAR